jgi:hypothetical protein
MSMSVSRPMSLSCMYMSVSMYKSITVVEPKICVRNMCPRRCSNPCPWVLSFFMFMFTFMFLFPSVSFYISHSASVSLPPFLPLFFHLSLSRSLSSARSPHILRFYVFPLCLFPPVSFPRIFPLSLSHRPSMSLQCLSPSVSPLPLSFRLSFL